MRGSYQVHVYIYWTKKVKDHDFKIILFTTKTNTFQYIYT